MHYDSGRNRVLLGTLDRIDYISVPEAMDAVNRADTPIHITKIMTNDGSVISPETYARGNLVLPSNSSVFIYLSSYDYSRETAQHFKFKLNEGVRPWYETGGNGNLIPLPNLTPGFYKVFAASANAMTSEDPLLNIRIKRPWYLSSFAFFVYFLLVGVLLYLLLAYLFMQKRIKIERLQRKLPMPNPKSTSLPILPMSSRPL